MLHRHGLVTFPLSISLPSFISSFPSISCFICICLSVTIRTY